MADKLGILKNIIGEELYSKVLDAVGKKEGDAELSGMVNKEAQDAETEKAQADDEKAEIDPKTGKPKKPKNAAAAAEEAAEDKKEAGDEHTDEALVAIFTKVVSDANAGVVSRLDALEASRVSDKKEFEKAVSDRFGAIESAIKEAKDGVEALVGDLPKGVKGRASQSKDNVVADEKAAKAGPAKDPEHFDFFSEFLLK